ncbi:profilin, required for normal timing of actin polymerization in response to thermal stress [Serendipita sp. 405]|nr:profilin, required for normal timing of actin polymerization in response to thermal stress [Serendipita sp. 397]KAG8803852.1 profilin, required for normal timing of actin polymerization in response to thermal stress [Serendipita sp. 400]KAG8843642.1 profilin, required for normal timing of actin polymerization in response to thermal stress [Serendipita sp. 405]
MDHPSWKEDPAWKAFLDYKLSEEKVRGNFTGMAIIGAGVPGQEIQRGAVWACSPGFRVVGHEGVAIPDLIGNTELAQTKGITLNGRKYFFVGSDDRSISGKAGPDGCVVVKAHHAIVVAVYKLPTQHPECYGAALVVADAILATIPT